MGTSSARQKVAERIATSLRRAIVDGRLRPGDALPSERELADKYDVNRSSIREAMKRLEAWGLIKIRHGGATRVSDFFLSASLEVLPHLAEVGARVDPGILRDLHEIRGLLLGWCAEQAARLADPSSIARLDEIARRLDDDKTRRAALQELDYDFFQELVAITGNRLLGLFANVIRDIYLKNKERFAAIYSKDVFDPANHRRAVAAIRARDPAAASSAMRAHAMAALKTLNLKDPRPSFRPLPLDPAAGGRADDQA
jgi:DNA-binding FadR family transcriptional regulator